MMYIKTLFIDLRTLVLRSILIIKLVFFFVVHMMFWLVHSLSFFRCNIHFCKESNICFSLCILSKNRNKHGVTVMQDNVWIEWRANSTLWDELKIINNIYCWKMSIYLLLFFLCTLKGEIRKWFFFKIKVRITVYWRSENVCWNVWIVKIRRLIFQKISLNKFILYFLIQKIFPAV